MMHLDVVHQIGVTWWRKSSFFGTPTILVGREATSSLHHLSEFRSCNTRTIVTLICGKQFSLDELDQHIISKA